MEHGLDILLADLRAKIGDLGQRGGLMSTSVYDTAQVLRLCPSRESDAAADWLLAQQGSDGGWGRPDVPLARHVPTLASVLALHRLEHRGAQAAAARGIAFLTLHAAEWREPLPDDIPVGVELLLPKLLEDSDTVGLNIPTLPYEALMRLGVRRRALIARMQNVTRTQAIHTWEAWGEAPDPGLLSPTGGLGDSPAATASFWAKAQGHAGLREVVERARRYLESAAKATEENRPGLVPTVWPINRFEQSFALYALSVAGLLDHAGLSAAVSLQLDDLARALRAEGLASSDSFIPDGDDTAAAIVALRMGNRPVDLKPLKEFEEKGRFCTWPHELQPSISVNARAIHALALFAEDISGPRQFVLERQRADGRWSGDKWNSSWIYTTALVVLALGAHAGTAHTDVRFLEAGVKALLEAQREDGSWGGGKDASSVETAWCVLALRSVLPIEIERRRVVMSLRRALRFLLANYRPFHLVTVRSWLAKETYGTPRLDRVVELTAMLTLALNLETAAWD
jgi:Squalene-hopene cyclase C-terminal domain/Prenyltransferase and squalene oxidase repeat